MSLDGLTAIIPVTRFSSNPRNLSGWIEDSQGYGLNIILVHDIQDSDSSDALKLMLSSYSKSKIKLIEGIYGSPGVARNQGIPHVETDLMAFWDSDDTPNLSGLTYSLLQEDMKWDILVGQYEIVDSESRKVIRNRSQDLEMNMVALNPGLWRMIFKKNFIGDTRFNSLLMGEDQIFLAHLISKSPVVHFSPETFYFYFKNVVGQLTSNRVLLRELVGAINTSQEIFYNADKQQKLSIAIMDVKKLITLFSFSKLLTFKATLGIMVKTFERGAVTNYLMFFRAANFVAKYGWGRRN